MSMTWLVGLVALFIVGGLFALQGAVNAHLATLLGSSIQAALISFSIGTLSLLILCLVSGLGLPQWQTLSGVPLRWWIGGCLGAIVVTSTIMMVPRVGVASVILMALAGQLFFSVLFDHFALMNLPRYTIDGSRVLGLICVIIGVLLCNRQHFKF